MSSHSRRAFVKRKTDAVSAGRRHRISCGGIRRFISETLAHGRNRLLFSSPAGAPPLRKTRGDRVNMTVRLISDEGETVVGLEMDRAVGLEVG